MELSSNIFLGFFIQFLTFLKKHSCIEFNFGVIPLCHKYSDDRSFYAQGMDSYKDVNCKFHASFLSLVQFLLYFFFLYLVRYGGIRIKANKI